MSGHRIADRRSWKAESTAALDEWLEGRRIEALEELEAAAEKCESEIERLLLARLAFVAVEHSVAGLRRPFIICRSVSPFPITEDAEFLWLIPQMPVGQYRVDFGIVYKDPLWKRPIVIAIECDGHDYHDGTKEQAERDKRRNRALTLADCKVLRFSGREIVRDPEACAEEVNCLLARIFCDALAAAAAAAAA